MRFCLLRGLLAGGQRDAGLAELHLHRERALGPVDVLPLDRPGPHPDRGADDLQPEVVGGVADRHVEDDRGLVGVEHDVPVAEPGVAVDRARLDVDRQALVHGLVQVELRAHQVAGLRLLANLGEVDLDRRGGHGDPRGADLVDRADAVAADAPHRLVGAGLAGRGGGGEGLRLAGGQRELVTRVDLGAVVAGAESAWLAELHVAEGGGQHGVQPELDLAAVARVAHLVGQAEGVTLEGGLVDRLHQRHAGPLEHDDHAVVVVADPALVHVTVPVVVLGDGAVRVVAGVVQGVLLEQVVAQVLAVDVLHPAEGLPPPVERDQVLDAVAGHVVGRHAVDQVVGGVGAEAREGAVGVLDPDHDRAVGLVAAQRVDDVVAPVAVEVEVVDGVGRAPLERDHDLAAVGQRGLGHRVGSGQRELELGPQGQVVAVNGVDARPTLPRVDDHDRVAVGAQLDRHHAVGLTRERQLVGLGVPLAEVEGVDEAVAAEHAGRVGVRVGAVRREELHAIGGPDGGHALGPVAGEGDDGVREAVIPQGRENRILERALKAGLGLGRGLLGAGPVVVVRDRLALVVEHGVAEAVDHGRRLLGAHARSGLGLGGRSGGALAGEGQEWQQQCCQDAENPAAVRRGGHR